MERLRALQRKPPWSERLILTGSQPHERIPFFLAASDVCILPSKPVTDARFIVPAKLHEYMASGRPVVATRLEGLEMEFGEDNGIIYAPSPAGVVEAALGLSRSREEWEKRSRQCRSFAEQNCDWERITDQFEALLSECARKA